MIDKCHYIFVQTHGMYYTRMKLNANYGLWLIGCISLGSALIKKKKGHSGEGCYQCGRLAILKAKEVYGNLCFEFCCEFNSVQNYILLQRKRLFDTIWPN